MAENNNTDGVATDETFKKPFDAPQSQRTAVNGNGEHEAIGKPTREIISCFMTTSGFISPAREGKLPDAKKPIIIAEDPEPEEIPTKQRTPTPEPVVVVESKHHSKKRDREIKAEPTESPSKNHGNETTHSRQNDVAPYDDFLTDGKEVKLYEVIQTVPDPPLPKKKTKKQLNMAHLKEQKKLKKINQLKANRNALKFGSDNASHPFADQDNQAMAAIHSAEKIKKKLHKMEALKKKRKQKQLIGMNDAGNSMLTEKQHKKRIAKLDKQHKLSKKNLQAMGLNPNAIEGFAILPSVDGGAKFPPDHQSTDPIQVSMKLNAPQKEGKKNKKLSNEPDKQKIKFFKKLSTTSSNLLSKGEPREHEIDRTMADTSSNLSGIDVNSQMTAHSFDATDGFVGDNSIPFARSVQFDLNRLAPDLEGLPPSKKQKLLKKLNKPPKEPKPPKIKKLKKDGLPRKERTPKAVKMLDASNEVPKPFAPAGHADENPLSKMFMPEFRPNVGLIPGEFPVPGLNPLNPLFQSVNMRFDLPGRDPMQNYPFPMQNLNFVDFSRFKRPNFNDPTQNDAEPMSLKYARDINNQPPKPLCNVAPLMPPSLLQMEHQRAELSREMPNAAMKHYPHDVDALSAAISGYGSKKSLPYSNPNEQYPEQLPQPFMAGHTHKHNDSPIVICSDDDDDDDNDKMRNNRSNRSNQSNPSQSPGLGAGPDQSFDDSGAGGSGEVKRKKVKDKKDKEKKEKKDKDTGIVKLKKKKDKKDKSKNKGEHSKPPKDKSALKKEKREKKKERERSAAALSVDTNDSTGAASNPFYGSQSHSEWPRDTFAKDPDHGHFHGDSSDVNATFNTDNSNLETSAIPKLTLKLAPSSSSPSSRTSRPSTPDIPVTKKGYGIILNGCTFSNVKQIYLLITLSVVSIH